MCWDDSEVRWAGVGLRNADEAEKRRRRMWWDGQRSTEVVVAAACCLDYVNFLIVWFWVMTTIRCIRCIVCVCLLYSVTDTVSVLHHRGIFISQRYNLVVQSTSFRRQAPVLGTASFRTSQRSRQPCLKDQPYCRPTCTLVYSRN